ncbi:Piso0_000183 [Millerozyma farinosa CBS 7064]|uniref:Piso0_000183 protein n=1 Tax=Pichia sorbitophila (strain ATCC MYA-4447 / BCRC 22081 / CBS 7064 / NBRC 10061 / NRRL Y-12695) TaxID=559304 RepID=G8YUR3_PICSO|nr:Piso0_000183 [Millerozyma farinosa CBS 7064]
MVVRGKKHSLPILGFGSSVKGRFQARSRRTAMATCDRLRRGPVSLSQAVFCSDSRLGEQETSLAFPTGALYEIPGTSTVQTASGVSEWDRAVVCADGRCSQATAHGTVTGGDGRRSKRGSPDERVVRVSTSVVRCSATVSSTGSSSGCTVSWML